MPNVFILGGGVAGLSAAHELAERGFNVVVFERHDICGGKARSMKNVKAGRPDLPGEHGFRFFPGFYWHLTHTMRRIVIDPNTKRTADQNLVQSTQIAIAQDGKPLFLIEAKRPKTLQDWITALREIVEDPSLGISKAEGLFFIKKIFCFLGSGPTRRLKEYEGKSWWDFIGAQTRSDQYRAVLARGLSQSLVAMRPDKASALTVGTMLVQILFNIIEGKAADRVLNAPTNEAWIDPWVKFLTQNPNVQILTNHVVTAINYDAGTNTVKNVTVQDANNVSQVLGSSADYYLAALPVDVVKSNGSLFPSSFKRAAGLSRPSSIGSTTDDGVDSLDTEWMTGVLFYLNRDVSSVKGHVIYSNSKWALTSVSQRQFWRAGFPFPAIAPGAGPAQIQDILSTIISDWNTPGDKVVTAPANKSTQDDIFNETWAQLKAHLNLAGNGKITDADLVERFLDPAITFDGTGHVKDNLEPLLVNTKNSRVHRPRASTLIPNFFVASDYVLTETDLACMEAANEAARQAVNAVLQASASAQPPCQIHPLEEPQLFRLFQQADDLEYQVDPSHPPALCRLVDLLLPDSISSPLSGTLVATLIVTAMNAAMLALVLYRLFTL
jgi:15-cis-phytoene desaturase